MEIKSGLRNATYVKNKPKITPAELKKQIARQRDKDREMVTGIFQNLETPRGGLVFPYKMYADDPIEIYDLQDGERYQIPRGVAKHLNNNCWYPEYKHMQGQEKFGSQGIRHAAHDGRTQAPSWSIMTKVHRFRFNRIDFDDDYETNQADIAQVTYAPDVIAPNSIRG